MYGQVHRGDVPVLPVAAAGDRERRHVESVIDAYVYTVGSFRIALNIKKVLWFLLYLYSTLNLFFIPRLEPAS